MVRWLERARSWRIVSGLARGVLLLGGLTTITTGLATSTALSRTKYGISVKADKKADFATFKTYKWITGQDVLLREVDKQLIAAVDRQLKALGLTKVESGPSDLQVSSLSVGRVDVNVKAKPTGEGGVRPQYPVGTIVVVLQDPGSKRQLFRGRADVPIKTEPATLNATIDDVVARIFEKYPTRRD